MIDFLYTNGDSWTHGSELADPEHSYITDHFHQLHDSYRQRNHWPKVLADKLNLPYMDSSFPGASNDRILRTSIADITELLEQGHKPLAVIGWTQLHRFELGKRTGGWRSFVSPADKDNPKEITELWAEWGSDYTDTVKWVTQLICFHSFCQTVGVPTLGLTVFSSSYRLLEDNLHVKEMEPYKKQLYNICKITEQAFQTSLESILKPYPNIKYGPGGHPLTLGHKTLGNFLAVRISQQFKIQSGTE